MMKFHEVIDLLREKQGFSRDQEVYSFIGLSRSQFYKMKDGKHALNEETVKRLMAGTGLEAPIIEGAWEIDFAKNEEVRKSWERFLSTAASVALVAPLLLSAAAERCILC